MATGWARDGAEQAQIDATVNDAVARVRSQLPAGAGTGECDECGMPIPPERRAALPGVRLCVHCQQAHDEHQTTFSGYNRRGSKDSQLR